MHGLNANQFNKCSIFYRGVNEEAYIKRIEVLEKEISVWKQKYKELFNKNQNLEKDLKKAKSEIPDLTVLHKIFTPGQIKLLFNPSKKRIRWASDDIASSISLRSISPKLYRFLREQGFPLPGLSTLRDWAKCLNLEQGTLASVMELMKVKAREMPELNRLAVLAFDKIYISNNVSIDPAIQQIVVPHRTCQTVMARGLLNKWKQPVYYGFDQSMTEQIMFDIISQLYYAGFNVVAITSDMGGGNIGFWSKLNVRHDKPVFFLHPVDASLKVHVFADVPHLLKLLRNHFLDHGFTSAGVKIDKTCLEKLLKATTSDLKICHKITRYHLDLKSTERQKVRPAAQLFSNTTSKAIEWCGMKRFMEGTSWQKTAELLKLINNWFDLFNSQNKYGTHPGSNAFGINLENQIELLNHTNEYISSMRVGTHVKLIQFQKGILLSNASLISLYQYLKETYTTLNICSHTV